MNIWDHCRLSVRKFGGKEEDYFAVHKFMDSSKLYYFNVRHRMLLHNLYGIELTIQKFGDTLQNSDQKVLLIRDIAAEHCKEDLDGKVPSLRDWLIDNDKKLEAEIIIPKFEDKRLEEFVLYPYWKSNLKSALIITLSNFGVYLAKEILGIAAAKSLHQKIDKNATVQNYLSTFEFTERWQFTPQRKELEWLAQNSIMNHGEN